MGGWDRTCTWQRFLHVLAKTNETSHLAMPARQLRERIKPYVRLAVLPTSNCCCKAQDG